MSQSQIDFTWSADSARLAADHGRIVVIVDTLSFSTVIALASSKGARIYPAATRDDARSISLATGAELAVRRIDVPSLGRYSLSPLTYLNATPETHVALFSPNGGQASLAAKHAPHVIAGALVNAGAVARKILQYVTNSATGITVVACGERMGPSGEEIIYREAVEDYLGAGAILAALDLPRSSAALDLPRSSAALDCAQTFLTNRAYVGELLRLSFSGQEFAGTPYAADVEFASRIDVLDVAPELHAGPLPGSLPGPHPSAHPWFGQ